MRPASTVVGLVVLACVAFGGSTSAVADPLPAYGGLLDFPMIKGSTDPEEYSWRVELRPGQELKAVDGENAAIYFEDGTEMGVIAAPDARDATGAGVPTSIVVSEGDIVTLTVHHQTGNPAKEGAPYIYPVTPGHSFEVGFSSVQVVTPPPAPPPLPAAPPDPALANCIVPSLKGWSLSTDRRRLLGAGCRLGEVRGARSKTAKVVKQNHPPGVVLPRGAEVGVKVGG